MTKEEREDFLRTVLGTVMDWLDEGVEQESLRLILEQLNKQVDGALDIIVHNREPTIAKRKTGYVRIDDLWSEEVAHRMIKVFWDEA
jgi:hypothetical protein